MRIKKYKDSVKIGVKTFKDKNFLEHFKDKVDFFEVMAIQGEDYLFLKKFKLPIIIHCQHQKFGINNADKTKVAKNKESIDFAIKLANKYKSKKIIVHAGLLNNKECSEEHAINFFRSINDKRVLIENLSINGNSICSTPEQTKKFMKKTGKNFCFDINHAIETAVFLKQDYLEMIKEFVKLKPKHYHLGGQRIEEEITHIPFKDSDILLKEIIKLIPKDVEITIESEYDIKKTEEDIKIIRRLIKR